MVSLKWFCYVLPYSAFLYLKASRDSLQVTLSPPLTFFDTNFCIKCNLIIFFFTNRYEDDKVQDGELGAKCNMQGGDENGHRILIGNYGGIRPHGRSRCRWDYNNKTGLISGRLCEQGNKPFRVSQRAGKSLLAERLPCFFMHLLFCFMVEVSDTLRT